MFSDTTFQFSLLWPVGLTVAAAVALAGAVVFATVVLLRKGVRAGWVTVLALLRFGAVAAFLLLVLQPVLTYPRAVEQRPELLVLVDVSRSMAGPGAAGKGSRLEEVLAACQKGDFAAALRDRFLLRWFAFDRTARPIIENEVATLRATGTSTQLAPSLTAAADHARALGQQPARVLVLGDGNDHGRDDPVATARRLGLTVDVLPPAAPAAVAPESVDIADVQGTRRVLLGSETRFRLTLRGAPPAERDRTVVLGVTENGKEVWRGPLTLKAGQGEETFSLSHRPATAGLKEYAFQLQPAARGPAGASQPYRLSVQVVDSKYEVLVLEDTWRWEYKFLHRLFEDDPSFRFTAFLARGKSTFVQFGSPDRRVNLIGPPQGRADLEGFDVFFLGDVDPGRWPRGLAATLAQLVTDEGKSLVVIAGPNLARLAEVPELHALLPVELTRDAGRPVEGPIDVRLRADAGSSPFFFQLRSGEAGKLPPLDQVYPALRKRPGATVLVEAVKQRNAYGNLIVVAEQTVGRGRVLFVGTDTLWKWQTLAPAGDGPTPYSIFWQQACRALTPLRTNPSLVNLWLTPQRSQVEVGQSVTVQAEIQTERPLARPVLPAAVTLPDERRLPLVFTADAANPLRFHTEFAAPLAGQVRVSAQLVVEGKTVAEATTALQVAQPRGEDADVGVNRAALARLAGATGGQVIDPGRPETWPAAGPPLPAVAQLQTLDLSANFTLLLVLCGLLGTDWLLRLFKGLL